MLNKFLLLLIALLLLATMAEGQEPRGKVTNSEHTGRVADWAYANKDYASAATLYRDLEGFWLQKLEETQKNAGALRERNEKLAARIEELMSYIAQLEKEAEKQKQQKDTQIDGWLRGGVKALLFVAALMCGIWIWRRNRYGDEI